MKYIIYVTLSCYLKMQLPTHGKEKFWLTILVTKLELLHCGCMLPLTSDVVVYTHLSGLRYSINENETHMRS